MSTRRRAAIGASEGKDRSESQSAIHSHLHEESSKSLTESKKRANIYKKPYPLSDGSSIKDQLKFDRNRQLKGYKISKNQASWSTLDKSQVTASQRKRSRKAHYGKISKLDIEQIKDKSEQPEIDRTT